MSKCGHTECFFRTKYKSTKIQNTKIWNRKYKDFVSPSHHQRPHVGLNIKTSRCGKFLLQIWKTIVCPTKSQRMIFCYLWYLISFDSLIFLARPSQHFTNRTKPKPVLSPRFATKTHSGNFQEIPCEEFGVIGNVVFLGSWSWAVSVTPSKYHFNFSVILCAQLSGAQLSVPKKWTVGIYGIPDISHNRRHRR